MTKAFPFMYKCCGKEILIVIAVAFLRDLVKRLSARAGTSDEAHNQRNQQEPNHAVGSNSKALALFSIDGGEH